MKVFTSFNQCRLVFVPANLQAVLVPGSADGGLSYKLKNGEALCSSVYHPFI